MTSRLLTFASVLSVALGVACADGDDGLGADETTGQGATGNNGSGGDSAGATTGSGGDEPGPTTGSGGDGAGATTGSGGDGAGATTGSGGDEPGPTTGSGGDGAGATTGSGGDGAGATTGSGGESASGSTTTSCKTTTTVGELQLVTCLEYEGPDAATLLEQSGCTSIPNLSVAEPDPDNLCSATHAVAKCEFGTGGTKQRNVWYDGDDLSLAETTCTAQTGLWITL